MRSHVEVEEKVWKEEEECTDVTRQECSAGRRSTECHTETREECRTTRREVEEEECTPVTSLQCRPVTRTVTNIVQVIHLP